ncbi:MAG TPA: VOC family protein [Solirubrobacteraceae bacterium]|jgi:catechol-2,3-dioxygenase|nr:VOC family protein [Solirubrobacteraceae bacterium]
MATETKGPVLHHVNIKTPRLAEMTEFYRTLATMDILFSSPGISFLSNDGANHRIALIGMPGIVDDPDKITRAGMHHCAFEYDTVGALIASYRRLRDAGIIPHTVIDHGMTLSFYYVDPDGNSVELQCDTYGDWTASTEFMTTSPVFAGNPLGIFIEPEQLADAFDAGADLAELHERAYAGEFEPAEMPDLRLPAPPA